MSIVESLLASYLLLSSTYNAITAVTLFFPNYGTYPACHHVDKDEITEEAESRSQILELAISYSTEAFVLPEIPSIYVHYTRCLTKSYH